MQTDKVTPTDAETVEPPVRPASELPFFSPDGSPGGASDAAFAKDPTHVFLEGHRKHGALFRVKFAEREQYAMAGVEANHFVWTNHDIWDYYSTNRHFREQFTDRYLNQLVGKPYLQKRRRMMQGFRPSVLMGHTDRMSEAIFREVDRLPDGVVDLRLFCMRVIIAMMARVLVQKDLPEGMDRTMALSNREMLKASNMGWKRWLWYQYPPKLWKRHKIFKYLGSILDERAQSGDPEKEDILSAVVSAQEKDHPNISRTELIHDLSQLFMAGSTTSSMIIAWSLIHSFTDTVWLEELRTELTDWDPYKFDSIDPYPKLRATTLEIERLHPGVPVFNRVTAEAFDFGGFRFPKGADVLHLHTLAHFMEEIYEDPDVFRPARFIENPELPPKDVHGTFSGGRHKCLGAPLARIQPPLFTANILKYYDMEFLTQPSLKEKYDAVVAPAEEPLMVRFTKRV
ncbi:MAG: cytochrome P450 [Verrucomicrobia bacterium]|jgi:sterol 14-demethylase|nr:cytochrome P450 [Verrucomicrobiota bacterium]